MAELTSDRTGSLVFPSSRTLPAGRVVRTAGVLLTRGDADGVSAVSRSAGLIVSTDSSAPPTRAIARQSAISGTIAVGPPMPGPLNGRSSRLRRCRRRWARISLR